MQSTAHGSYSRLRNAQRIPSRVQLSKKSLAFMEPEGPLPLSQQPAICPWPEPDQSSPRPLIFSLESVLISFFLLRLGSPSDVFLSFPHQNPVCTNPIPIRVTSSPLITLLQVVAYLIGTRHVTSRHILLIV